MSELQKYYIEIDGPYVWLSSEAEGRISLADCEAVYLAADVDAIRVADAERITHLCVRLEIAELQLANMCARYEREED